MLHLAIDIVVPSVVCGLVIFLHHIVVQPSGSFVTKTAR